MDDLIGQRLGEFQVLALLGQGAMAKVYKARQESQGRDVALKVIRRVPGDSAESTARFEREKTALEKLEHPHIMPIYEFAANRDYLWIASPLVLGGTLEERLAKGPLSLAEVCRVVQQLGSAIDLAERKAVVHRDIKPSNVMIDSDDNFILSDYGVAKLIDAEGLTAPGMTLGTPEYMSPEQVLGKPLTSRSDQYSLAIMAYQLLSGSVPFKGKLMAVMEAQARSTPPSLLEFVSPEVEKTILKALAKDPNQRYPSASEFAAALASAAGVEEVEDLPPGGTMQIQALKIDEVEELPPGGTMHIQALKAEPDEVEELPPGGTMHIQALRIEPDEVEELPPGGTMHIQALKVEPEPVEVPPASQPSVSRSWKPLVGVAGALLLLLGLWRVLQPSPVVASPLYYQVRSGSISEIWLRRPDGSRQSLGSGSQPRPWPGGKSILLVATEGKGGQNLFRVDLTSGERQSLTHFSLPVDSGSVSPDGKLLVFSATKKAHRSLYRMELGGKPGRLDLGKGNHQTPSFSPDGESLAYASDTDGPMGIWVFNFKSKKKRRLTRPEGKLIDVSPDWSPDGKRLVFERQGDGTRQIVIVDLEGKEEGLESAGAARQPTWAPSSRIGYVTDQGIFQIPPGGAAPPQLLVKPEAGKELLFPAWASP